MGLCGGVSRLPTTVIGEKFGTTVGTIISKAQHDLMKVVWIWVTALILSAIPVGLLARRNRPSVLTGALVVALFVVFALGGLGLGGAGAGPSSDLAGLLILWIVVMAVLGWLLLITFARMNGSFVERIKSTAVGVGVWILVGMIVSRASGEMQDLQIEASAQESVEQAARAEAEIPRTRAKLDRTPERRRAVLDSTLAQVNGEVGVLSYRREVDRFVVFGDPATEPNRVVVWAVVTPTVHVTWLSYSFYGERLHQRVNTLLRERGYPVRIALGFAPSTAIDSAGGDEVYFGRDGSKVIPQYLPDNVIGNHPRRLEAPRRKG